MWEIIDDNGIIHSGTEEEMTLAFNVMCDNLDETISISKTRKLQHEWDCEWNGDLKLINVINTCK